jgi:hypothetical protein
LAERWSLTSLREKLIKIGARVVSLGRYVIFQMAEVAVSRPMFKENPIADRAAASAAGADMTGVVIRCGADNAGAFGRRHSDKFRPPRGGQRLSRTVSR